MPDLQVLLLCDEPLLSRALQDGLTAKGILARCATEIPHARDLLTSSPWNAVILDSTLSEGETGPFLHWMAERLGTAAPPVLLLGARLSLADPPQHLLNSLGAHSVKDFSMSVVELLATLERVLGTRSESLSLLGRQADWLEADGAFDIDVGSRQAAIRLLVSLALNEETGAYRRSWPDFHCEIHLVRGQVVSVDTPDAEDALGYRVVEAGMTDETWMSGFVANAGTVPLGARLIQSGILRPMDLRHMLRTQARRRTLDILRKEGGRIEWRPTPEPRPDPLEVHLDPIPLTWETAHGLPAWCCGAIRARPIPTRHVGLLGSRLPLSDAQRAFLGALDGRRSVAMAAETVGVDLHTALALCPMLVAVAALDDPEGTTSAPLPKQPLPKTRSREMRGVEIRIAQAYRDRRWEDVVRMCEPIVHALAASPNVPCWLARARLHLGAPPVTVLPLLEAALAREPSFPVAHKILGRVLGGLGHTTLAEFHERMHRCSQR